LEEYAEYISYLGECGQPCTPWLLVDVCK
jgi:hypothetical protein